MFNLILIQMLFIQLSGTANNSSGLSVTDPYLKVNYFLDNAATEIAMFLEFYASLTDYNNGKTSFQMQSVDSTSAITVITGVASESIFTTISDAVKTEALSMVSAVSLTESV